VKIVGSLVTKYLYTGG